LAFFGTSCKEGGATGIVINIGDNTVIGQIASLASASRVEESTLTREINRFILGMCIISFSLGGLLFVLGYALGYTFVNNIVFAIGIIVANVPEGLLATLTVAIGMAAQRLAKAKVLVKNLDSVETLGCTTVICSDKTGTLTQNKMTVSSLWYNNDTKRADNIQKRPKDYKFAYDVNDPAFQVLHNCAILSSDATFNDIIPEEKLKFLEDIPEKQREEKRRKVEEHYKAELKTKIWLDRPTNGDASESALIKFFQPIQDILETRSKFPVVQCSDGSKAKMPFNSVNKFALTIVKYPTENSHFCLYIKVITDIMPSP
jgi:sodium/potassium-transporting ATPase subunit alpha